MSREFKIILKFIVTFILNEERLNSSNSPRHMKTLVSHINSNPLHTISFPFKLVPLDPNAFPHPSFPRLHALLEGYFRVLPQFSRYGLFNVHDQAFFHFNICLVKYSSP